jgi:cellulose synthase/poly-beta-1,6-N-acetylglucosamine synthase-like glycosyltransferase
LILLLALLPVLFFVYSYLLYPLVLRATGGGGRPMAESSDPAEWPSVTLTLPVYNEAATVAGRIQNLLEIDYPRERLQILVISDASSDGTDDVVRRFAAQGVELLRLSKRGGKTAAENAAASLARGEIVVNTDATSRVLRHSLKALVRPFADPGVGVASGRDVSVGDVTTEANEGESGYVGYEMRVRAMETRVGSIVGASGCFYGIRRSLYAPAFPEELSRDFASALIAREHGFRAVSVDDAIVLVPRTTSIQKEYNRKIRTMARGLETLWYKRHLMNPFRYGRFAFMLISHKLCRWLVPATLPLSLLALAALSFVSPAAAVLFFLALTGVAVGWIGMRWPEGRRAPKLVSIGAFVLAANLAGVLAWVKAIRGQHNATWEPTRRPI